MLAVSGCQAGLGTKTALPSAWKCSPLTKLNEIKLSYVHMHTSFRLPPKHEFLQVNHFIPVPNVGLSEKTAHLKPSKCSGGCLQVVHPGQNFGAI